MKIAHGTLVMAIDGQKLLLFRNEGDEKYPILETLLQEASPSAGTREQGSDRTGRCFSGICNRRRSYDETDRHQKDEDDFAEHATQVLESAVAGSDAGVVVLAPPRTLGVLRKRLRPNTRSQLLAEIDKDFAHRTTDDLVEAISGTAEPISSGEKIADRDRFVTFDSWIVVLVAAVILRVGRLRGHVGSAGRRNSSDDADSFVNLHYADTRTARPEVCATQAAKANCLRLSTCGAELSNADQLPGHYESDRPCRPFTPVA
jgi:protein required for attachment to host cells